MYISTKKKISQKKEGSEKNLTFAHLIYNNALYYL